MASNVMVQYIAKDKTKFTFCLIFNAYPEMEGIVVRPDANVEHSEFRLAVKWAQINYPYWGALETLAEYGDLIIHRETIIEGQSGLIDIIEDGIRRDIYDPISPELLQLARDIKNEKWRDRTYEPKKVSQKRAGFVYLVEAQTDPVTYKIGRTSNLKNRQKTFGVKLPFPIEFICTVKTDDMIALETSLHERFSDKRLSGEFFDLSPEDIEYIKAMANEL